MLRTLLLTVVLTWLTPAMLPAAQEESPYRATLISNNITPTRDGLSTYLRSLEPTPEQTTRAKRLIAQLGDATSFARREEAMQKLIALAHSPLAELNAATEHADPEIRWRAKATLLAINRGESEKVLYAVLKTIDQEEVAGLADDLLIAINASDKRYLRQAGFAALKATATESDATLLLDLVKSRDTELAVCCLFGVGGSPW